MTSALTETLASWGGGFIEKNDQFTNCHACLRDSFRNLYRYDVPSSLLIYYRWSYLQIRHRKLARLQPALVLINFSW